MKALRRGAGCLAAVLAALTYAAQAEPVTVQDQRGRIVELAAPAQRIVSIPIPLPSVIMALDSSAQRLVGIHPAARQSIEDGFLKKVFPEALNIPSDVIRGGQFNPNLESILALRPDLVVQWHQPAELISTLDNAGLRVVGLYNDPPTQEINERNLLIIGQLIGREDRVRALLTRNRATYAKIAAVTETIPDGDRPRVIYFREFGATIRPAGSNNYRDFWINLSGGRNAANALKGLSAAVNMEQIITWNPEVVFLGAFDESTPQMLLSAPELAGVDAIKHRRVYKLPHGGYRWDPGSHESALAWQWAALLLHPTRFDFDLRAEMRASYDFFYNYALADAEIDDILQMPLNKHMSGYARFEK